MNQFNKFRDFVHGNSPLLKSNSKIRNDKHVISSEVMKDEKHVENIKNILTTADKKISNSLISPRTHNNNNNNDSLLAPEKRTKKFPSTSLNKFFNEASETLLSSKSDSVLSKTLLTCSQLQNEFTNILVEHESNVEQNCLQQIEKYLDDDLPSIHRMKKQLMKQYEELKSSRNKYESIIKSNAQQNSNNFDIQNKIESLRNDVENNEQKLEQYQDQYESEIFEFLGKELTISEIFFQYIKLLESYHENMLTQIRHYIPVLEGVLQNSSQRPVFGCPLDEHLRSSGRKISIVIEKCVEFLIPFVREEGLFRIPGSISKVKRMRNAFNAGRLEALTELKTDAPAVVSTLKSYLRELPEPLLTFRLYKDWIEAVKVSDSNERLKAIWTVCNKLPEENRKNLGYLLKFLNELTKYTELNKMSSQNLAIALGPSLLWSESESFDFSNYLPTLVEALITYCDYFFPNEFSEFKITNSPVSPLQSIDSSSFSDNSDDQDSSLLNSNTSINSGYNNMVKLSPVLTSVQSHVQNAKMIFQQQQQQQQQQFDKKKKPAPKPPSTSMTTSLQSIDITSASSTTATTTTTTSSFTSSSLSSPVKIRPKISSFRFPKPADTSGANANNKQESAAKVSNRVDSPPAAVYLTNTGPITSSGEPGIYLRKSPESMTTFRPHPPMVAGAKIRPKSVCERPMVAPPSIPPRPSLAHKQPTKAEIDQQNLKFQQQQQQQQQQQPSSLGDNIELNHIDSESDDQNSRSSKDLSDISQQQKLQKIDDIIRSTIEEQQLKIYPSLEGITEKHSNNNDNDDDDDDIEIPSEPDTTPPPPRRPPRTHSSNSSTESCSNLSINDNNNQMESSNRTTTSPQNIKKQHQRSASTSISSYNTNNNNNNNNNPFIDDNNDNLKLDASKDTIETADHRTYL